MYFSAMFTATTFAQSVPDHVAEFVELARETCLRGDLSAPAIQQFWKNQSGRVEIETGHVGFDNLEDLTVFYDKHLVDISVFALPRNLSKQAYLNTLHVPQHIYYSDIGAFKGNGYLLWMRRPNELEKTFSECRLDTTFASRIESLALLKTEFSPNSDWVFEDDIEKLATLNSRFFSSGLKSLQNYPAVDLEIKIDCPSAQNELGVSLVVRPVGNSWPRGDSASASALKSSLVRICGS